MNKMPFLLILLLAYSQPLSAQTIEQPSGQHFTTTFAIIADEATYQQAKAELEAYKASVEAKGLGAYLIHHDWKNPEQVRDVLLRLYQQKPKLEGTLLVGDIPVPMIRDAQHLTSTFKMDQRMDWKRSSVPSDRFYDDFDLRFQYLKQDSLQKAYYYYSLDPASPQYIQMDIYSARIKPPKTSPSDFYEGIRRYLKKAVAQAKQQQALRQLAVYTGHGYHSESLNAWAGEQVALREQLPVLFRPGGQAKFLRFSMDLRMKDRILSEIQRPDLDIAIFHDHGSEDSQLINGYPEVSAPQPAIDNIRRYLRAKIQAVAEDKGDTAATKKRYHESLGVPYSWMDDALLNPVKAADSILNTYTEILIPDLQQLKPNARLVIMDACTNGAFLLDDYIGAHYVFGNGNSIAVLANSVAVLQDQWPDKLLGLLDHGVRLGNWFKETAYLETHLLGDPTFAFSSQHSDDLNQVIAYGDQKPASWQKLLAAENPDVQSLALIHLFRLQGERSSALLRKTYFQSANATLRLEALKLLSQLANADYLEVLRAAANDPYELTRRLAIGLIGEAGNDELIPVLVSSLINDRQSERVLYRANTAASFMSPEKMSEEIKRQIAAAAYLVDGPALEKQLLLSQKNTAAKLKNDYQTLLDSSIAIKSRMFSVRSLRAYRYHQAVPQAVAFVEDGSQVPANRIAALEALSWYKLSYQKPLIQALCTRLLENGPEALKEQARRTAAILGLPEPAGKK
ncbi:hypothetical protein SAMN05216436_101139 [bacterium A37T11]|nr:hypothetical protein SAMN05216436_10158 [bacterium A37T11]SEM00916.1 hypothetical protein SAMN05216436_101139 [bacterium A37T11]